MSEIFEILHREFVYIWYYFDVQLRQILGYWALGILLGSCVSVFLKDNIYGLLRGMSQSQMGSGKSAWNCFSSMYVRHDPSGGLFLRNRHEG